MWYELGLLSLTILISVPSMLGIGFLLIAHADWRNRDA